MLAPYFFLWPRSVHFFLWPRSVHNALMMAAGLPSRLQMSFTFFFGRYFHYEDDTSHF